MGRGLGVGGAPGSVGIQQTCVRQARNLPVVLKMILLKVQVKKITSKKRVKSICPRCLMSPLALICWHGARPRDSDNILTDGASLQLCGKLEVWGLWHIMTEERSHECLVRAVNFWSRRIPPSLPPAHSGIIKTTNSLENILLMTQYRPCYDRAKIILDSDPKFMN